MKNYSAYSARTTFPNTPQTDMEPTVLHTVTFLENGEHGEIDVHAECPISAIKIVQNIHREK